MSIWCRIEDRPVAGSPQALGFERSPDHDKFAPGFEVWRTPEKVLLALPPGCTEITLDPLTGPRGTTMVCIDPPEAKSIWPFADNRQPRVKK